VVAILREYGTLKDWNRSLGEIVLTNNSRIKLFSGEEPDRLRGPQHHGGWFDELASFKYPDAFDQYKLGLRLGDHPQTVVTTTPRPIKLIKDLANREDVQVIRGSTFDNAANLSESALTEMRLRYEGTRLGRQELYGELLEDVEGALWTRQLIEESRVQKHPALARIVVAIDPAVTTGEDSDETGIVVCGLSNDNQYYVLEDCTTKENAIGWAHIAVNAYHRWGADRIIGETNNGGDMIELLMRQVDPNISYRKVTATRGKLVRAEPVAALYEQKRAHHVGGFPQLEDQMCNWMAGSPDSPDRMDALVWAITDLIGNSQSIMGLAALSKFCDNCQLPAPKSATICTFCNTPFAA